MTPHASGAAGPEWTDDKRRLDREGLRGLDAIVAALRPEPEPPAEGIAHADALSGPVG